MKLLVLGGTRFLGRHLVQQALERGHEVTLLHRGRSAAALFPQARHLLADRNGDLGLLRGHDHWDAAIDTSAYLPRQVRAVGAALVDRVDHYQLVSTISVYAEPLPWGADEDAALRTLDDPGAETVSGDTYGGFKALCENEARAAFGARCLVSRPGLIVGPYDPTGRFTWWVQRARRGGTIVAPGDPNQPVQFIDARDAAAWMLLQAERQRGALTCNLCGPLSPLPMAGFVQALCDVLAPPGTQLRWIDEATLQAQGVAEWTDLPMWLTQASAALNGVSNARATALGLQCRPLAHTLRDTAAWAADEPMRAGVGLTPQREAALLAATDIRS